MGSNKNKRNSLNNHRHVFRKRYHPQKYMQQAALRKARLDSNNNNSSGHNSSSSISDNSVPLISGSRIINLEKLQEYVNELVKHAVQCKNEIVLVGEQRAGLASILSSECSKCHFCLKLATSSKVKGPRGYSRWECNLGAVWGQMSTGGGYSKLNETMSVLGVPVMSSRNFVKTERAIGEVWKEELQEIMIEAGMVEKRLAEERGDYHDGIPAITVIVDGGWSKRSHRHSYNAKSGVGIVIGKATGKLLYVGVRNKYCTACTQGVSKEKHECFKNWDQSSSQMEADIILEAFKQAEKVHGLRYIRFIGDGDSSVHSTLIQGVPGWGRFITKLECANHCCKCYRSSLEKLVLDKPSYKGKGGLTEKM